MMKPMTNLTLIWGASAAIAAVASTVDEKAVFPPPPVELPVIPVSWKCPDCNANEKYVLKELQATT